MEMIRTTIRIALAGLLVLAAAGLAFAQEKTQVTFWHAMGGARTAFIQRMVDDFNYTHPTIEVKAEYKGSYRDTLNAAILAAKQGNPAQIVQIFEVGSQLALDSGIFMPFEDTITPEDYAMLDDFVPGVANYYKFDGKFYSVPFNSSNAILYYNKDVFTKAGLDPENPPKTFDEVTAACKKIVESGAAPYGISFPLHCWLAEEWMANQGALLANNENGRAGRATDILLDSEPMKKIMSWWKELYDNKYYAYSGKPEDWDGANNLFISGQAAMEVTSTSDVAIMQNAAAENGFTLGTGKLPSLTDDPEGAVVGGASLWMTKGNSPEVQDAAKTFLIWFTNTENEVRWHKGTGYFPVRVSAVDVLKEQKWFERNPAFSAAFDQLLDTKPTRATQGALLPIFPQLRTIVEEAAQKIFDGTPVDEAMAEADKRADDALTKFNRGVQ
ncbi:ABC transporter substrate-binding protein [Oceanidesulfovibrio marinus]|uniref:sn-glycerol-3-phosphate-binding periplasmic protein UgpB n=2 Tax=Oceanidesulfovibrio marinus TaxID=370038 RepID=A0A6P1ZKF4_9BACT|nr:ABC transporter substrate-binding protein [Oceanidesulfovibrio marinus]